jgi:hypothetical protein
MTIISSASLEQLAVEGLKKMSKGTAQSELDSNEDEALKAIFREYGVVSTMKLLHSS